jgi:dolichol-phosphate mannosyltransferase
MTASGRLYLVVPLFDEEANLPRLFASFERLREAPLADGPPRLVLVDDGSRDATASLCTALATRGGFDLALLRQGTNQGPGRAFTRAFEHLAPLLRDEDWVATLEGDNTSRVELIQRMFVRAAEGFEVVLASPYIYGGAILKTVTLRVFVSYVANVFLKESLGLRGIFTMSSFFRLHRGSVVRRLQAHYGPGILERAGFECMVEMLIKLVHLRATLSEVPMVLDTSLREGRSKMSVTRTTFAYLGLWGDKRRWCRSGR